MANKVIEEVDEKLEGEIGSKKKIAGINLIYSELTSTKRQVNKLIGGLRQFSQSVPNKKEEPKGNQKAQPTSGKKENKIGKYNYYGKRYRFEEKEEELHVEPVKVQRQCASEIHFQKKQQYVPSPKTQKNANKSQNAVIDESIFFDDGQIKIPSHKYYIYFDQPQKSLANKKKLKSKNQRVIQDPVPQKFKPAWFMEKKINSLQRQLKQMKDREKRRYLDQSQELKAMRNTFDGPIRLQSNIERMVETLWR